MDHPPDSSSGLSGGGSSAPQGDQVARDRPSTLMVVVSKVVLCRVRFFVYPVYISPGITRTRQFFNFLKTLIPVLDSFATSVGLSYPYPTVL